MSWPDLLDSVKTELKITVATDNDALRAKIAAACAEIERRVGHVPVVTVTETFDVGCDGQAVLAQTPVAAVAGVAVVDAAGTVLRDLGGGTDVDPSGVLYGLPTGRVRVIYVAGLDPVPADYLEAAVQLSAHLWRISRSLDNRGRMQADAMIGPGMSSAMPNKVRDLLGLSGKSSRSRVFAG